jgi:hypothetical protein
LVIDLADYKRLITPNSDDTYDEILNLFNQTHAYVATQTEPYVKYKNINTPEEIYE